MNSNIFTVKVTGWVNGYGLFFSALWIVIPLGLLVAIFMWLAVYTNDWEALSRFMERPLFKKEG